MDNESQAQLARGGRPPGVRNYQNNVLIDIVERLLPQGLEGWREVALEYQRESNEPVLRRGEDVRDNWVKKLCKNMKKPTGTPGDLRDRHFRCLRIERRIQDRVNAAILGVDSAESSHRDDDGTKSSDDDDDDGAAEVGVVGITPEDIQFSPIRPENEGGDVDEEVAAANNAGEMNAAVARGEDAARARPSRASSAVSAAASSAFSASASQGGRNSTAPRRSPSSFVVESGGGGGEKTKNSTNRDRVSLSKSIQRVAESLETAGGGGGESGMMVSMLSMQMQQQAQQFSMQQQMFQQQMQMQMAAIERRAEVNERRAEVNEKYLRRIAKAVGSKRKRGDSDEDDGSSGDDE
jgi:hypothetical protein